jgi:hypothetical protein
MELNKADAGQNADAGNAENTDGKYQFNAGFHSIICSSMENGGSCAGDVRA